MSVHNLCFEQKYEKYQNFYLNTLFLVVKFSVYLNRRVFIMKFYNKICVTTKDSNQPFHPPSMARVLVYPSLDSLEAVEDTCNQRKLWSDCMDAQADLSLCWWHKSYCRFCHALAYLNYLIKNDNHCIFKQPKLLILCFCTVWCYIIYPGMKHRDFLCCFQQLTV